MKIVLKYLLHLSWNAAKNGHTDVVRICVQQGANVDIYNSYPLRYAVKGGHHDAALALLSASADLHANNDESLSPGGMMELENMFENV